MRELLGWLTPRSGAALVPPMGIGRATGTTADGRGCFKRHTFIYTEFRTRKNVLMWAVKTRKHVDKTIILVYYMIVTIILVLTAPTATTAGEKRQYESINKQR